MTATIDRVALEWRIEALSTEILATDDVLRKLDLVQARYETRQQLVSLEIAVLERQFAPGVVHHPAAS